MNVIKKSECPYRSFGKGICHDCFVDPGAYGGCARYKYANITGPHNLPDYVGVLDQGRLLELCH